jgi:tRNA(adenine34) deaminase
MAETDNIADQRFMRMALDEARRAADEDEVPIGAVIVAGGQVVAKAHNLTERLNDVTAHAEMQAITAAATALGGKYLNDCTLYVTVEPCLMCAGALAWAQIGRIVYATPDAKRGFTAMAPSCLHPRTQLQAGIMQEEAAAIVRHFFRQKR